MRCTRLAAALSVLTLGCASPWLATTDEWIDCLGSTEVHPAVMIDVAPDAIVQYRTSNSTNDGQPWENGGLVTIETWDCIDMAWWSPVPRAKVLQVWVDDDQCESYDAVFLDFYDCYDRTSPDVHHRDLDGDGYSPAEGDMDDDDPTVYPGADADTGGDTGAP